MSTPDNTNPAILKALVKELLTVKELKNISVRELLSIEDGFYKLKTPIEFESSKGKEVLLTECALNYGDEEQADGIYLINFSKKSIDVQLTIGKSYHIKLEFSSGLVAEKDLECKSLEEGSFFEFDDSMFNNLATGLTSGVGVFPSLPGELGVSGLIALTTPKEGNMAKYGDSVIVTIADTDKTTGEISGVISISTDTKILDGVTKVITALADDTSYYVDNIWQDGDTLEVSAMDETSGGDESGSDGGLKTATVTLVNGSLSCLRGAFLEDGFTMGTNWGTEEEATLILSANGEAYITATQGVVDTSGDIAFDEAYDAYRVWGDCTINFSNEVH